MGVDIWSLLQQNANGGPQIDAQTLNMDAGAHGSDLADDGDILSRTKRYVISQGFMDQSRIVALYIIFIILILIANGAMIGVILASKTMRHSSRHVLMISVCLGDLLMGVFVLPVLLNLGLRTEDGGTIDCTSFNAMRIFADFLIPSITTLAVLALNFDYLLRISCSPYGEGIGRVLIMASLFLLPWVASCLILIPMYLSGLHSIEAPQGSTVTTCAELLDVKLRGEMTRSLLIVCFFPQAFLLLIINVIVTCVFLFKRDTFGLDVCGERVRAPVDICLASFATLMLYTPVFLISYLTTEGYLGCVNKDECNALRDLYICAIWLFFAKSWLLPLAWLACRDTRSNIRKLVD